MSLYVIIVLILFFLLRHSLIICSHAWPGSPFADQQVLWLMEIHLPLPPLPFFMLNKLYFSKSLCYLFFLTSVSKCLTEAAKDEATWLKGIEYSKAEKALQLGLHQ